MIEVTVEQATARMNELLDRANAGEEIIMVRSGHPVARLVPYTPERATAPRIPGRCAGQIVVAGDFNAPLPDDLLDAFEQ
jgi:prevent-host-death family protein